MKHSFLAVLLAAALASAAAAQDDRGMEAYQAGDYDSAVRIWSDLAELGNVIAQFNLGGMYQKGLGVDKDSAEAFRLFEAAAEQGHASSQYNLGVMYANATGVARDYVEAYKWTSLAIEDLPEGEEQDLALRVRDVISRRMSPEQLAEATGTAEPADRDQMAAAAAVAPAAVPPADEPAAESAVMAGEMEDVPDFAAATEPPALVSGPPALAAATEPAELDIDPSFADQVAGPAYADEPEVTADTDYGDEQDYTDTDFDADTDQAEMAALAGSYSVQLASYRSEGMAQEGWRRLSNAHESLMAGFEPFIEQTDLIDRGTIYRLKIGGFGDRADASDWCADLQAEGGDCLVVKIQ